MNKWYGYIHQNGTTHVKRYFDPMDINDAQASPFVAMVILPFEAANAEDAMRIAMSGQELG